MSLPVITVSGKAGLNVMLYGHHSLINMISLNSISSDLLLTNYQDPYLTGEDVRSDEEIPPPK